MASIQFPPHRFITDMAPSLDPLSRSLQLDSRLPYDFARPEEARWFRGGAIQKSILRSA